MVRGTREDVSSIKARIEPESLSGRRQRNDEGGIINIALPDLVMTVSSSRVH